MNREKIIEAIGDAWATIDGKQHLRRVCKRRPDVEGSMGYLEGYNTDAAELLRLLEKSGFEIIEKRASA